MAEENEVKRPDKAEAKEHKRKKPPGYRKFQKLLKLVIASPPMRRPHDH
jgi:hypothetical protein